MGVHRSTYYRWKAQVERLGWRCSGPGSAGGRRCPTSSQRWSSSGSSRSALGHPGLGPAADRDAARAAGMGRLAVSAPTASTRAAPARPDHPRQALALVAGYARPYEPPREPEPEPHVDSDRPGELVGIDCFFVGRLHGTKGPVWQITAIDTYSSLRLGRSRRLPTGGPDRRAHLEAGTPRRRRALSRRLAARARAHRQRQRVRPPRLRRTPRRVGVRHTQIRSGRPQTNGHVERLHRTILEECWRPAFARYLQVRFTGLGATSPTTSTTTTTTATTTDATRPADPGRPRLRCPQDGAR